MLSWPSQSSSLSCKENKHSHTLPYSFGVLLEAFFVKVKIHSFIRCVHHCSAFKDQGALRCVGVNGLDCCYMIKHSFPD